MDVVTAPGLQFKIETPNLYRNDTEKSGMITTISFGKSNHLGPPDDDTQLHLGRR